MNEPRFGRMWRRRAFGLPRSASRKAFDRSEPQLKGLGVIADAISAMAAKIGLKLRARRARIRLVHPAERPPAPVDPAVVQTVRLDAKGLQRMLEAEFHHKRPHGAPAEDPHEPERFRRSG